MERNNGDVWLQRELQLNHRYEELLLRREVLLRGTETYYDTQIDRPASFVADPKKAKIRNDKLYKDWGLCLQDLSRRDDRGIITPRFQTLQNNYWTMVKNVFPVWQDEVNDYNRRHRYPTPQRSVSPRLPTQEPSGVPGMSQSFLFGSLSSTSRQPHGILKLSNDGTIRSTTGTMKSTSFAT